MAAAIPFVMAAMSAYSAISAANAKSAEQNQVAQANDYNAQVAENRSQTALQQAGAQEEAQRRKARVALGNTRAALAQSGMGLDGSSADVYEQSAKDAEMDALTIRYGGVLESKGLSEQAQLYKLQAGNARANSSRISSGALLGAAGAGLSGYGAGTKLTA